LNRVQITFRGTQIEYVNYW